MNAFAAEVLTGRTPDTPWSLSQSTITAWSHCAVSPRSWYACSGPEGAERERAPVGVQTQEGCRVAPSWLHGFLERVEISIARIVILVHREGQDLLPAVSLGTTEQ